MEPVNIFVDPIPISEWNLLTSVWIRLQPIVASI